MKPKIVRAVHPNQGIQAAYRKRLNALVAEMHRSVQYWIKAAYTKAPPRLATDESPSDKMRKEIEELARRWKERFEKIAPDLAENYSKKSFKATDSAFKKALKDAGFAVEFKMTPPMKDALDATINANVGLIKSIPEKYLADVEGIVMRSYAQGRDLHSMVTELNALYPQAKRRNELIARDQSNKANAVVTRARRLELGIKTAKWMHSGGGKEPRQSHVKASGKEFDVEKGMLIDGEYIQPGELINCRCVSRSILPF